MKWAANLGRLDRVLRLAVGIGLTLWAATGGPLLAWLGIGLVINAATAWCPAYQAMGHTPRAPMEMGSAPEPPRHEGGLDRNP